MSQATRDDPSGGESGPEQAPGEGANQEGVGGFWLYTAGLVFALLLTGGSFLVAKTGLIWGPGVPVGLAVLAVAQMGVHLVFFLHMSSGPDHTNTVLALAFGILIVTLVVSGSLWIMANLNANMMPMRTMMEMGR